MESNKVGFNIIVEPWIPVTLMDGTYSEISLKDFFQKAHEINSLAGEMPTQDASTLRFLLAVTYAVVLRKKIDGTPCEIIDKADALDRWEEYWSKGAFDGKMFEKYLNGYRDRFNLCDRERPFYQFVIPKGSPYKAKKLIGDLSESNNKKQLFAYVNGKPKDRISPAEATRWLIHLIGYDDVSLKPKNKTKDDPKEGPKAKAGWLGRLGLVYLKGRNMFETVMLNLPLVSRDGEPFPDGKAIWEADQPVLTERRAVPIPDNPLELLTVPSRRVKLSWSDGMVIGYEECVGDQFSECCSNIEAMTMWRLNKEKDWVPMTHSDTSKAIWRDYAPLLVKGTGRMEPGVIKWYSELVDASIVPKSMLSICVVGMSYSGKPPSSIDNIFYDGMSVNTCLLSSLGAEWNIRIDEIVNITEECIKKYKFFIKNILIACGEDEADEAKWGKSTHKDEADKPKWDMTSAYILPVYASLDLPFRSWLSTINPETTDMEVKCNEWLTVILSNTLLKFAEKVLKSCPPSSYVGAPRGEGSDADRFSTIDQFRRFKIDLNKTIRGE